jgi:hypothetical protein
MSSVSDKLHAIKCQLACAASFLGVRLLEQDDLVRFMPTEVVPLEIRTIIDQGVLSSISRIYQICGCEILDLVYRCRIANEKRPIIQAFVWRTKWFPKTIHQSAGCYNEPNVAKE